jgi:hypothetical protein
MASYSVRASERNKQQSSRKNAPAWATHEYRHGGQGAHQRAFTKVQQWWQRDVEEEFLGVQVPKTPCIGVKFTEQQQCGFSHVFSEGTVLFRKITFAKYQATDARRPANMFRRWGLGPGGNRMCASRCA